jgi:hypothetical protein
VRRGKVAGYLDYFDERQVAAMEDRVRSQLSPVFGYSELLGGEAASPLQGSSRKSSGPTGAASADPVGAR